jgi:hypothetical protein
VVEFGQRRVHVVEALKLDEAGAHELLVAFVGAHAELEGLEFGEVGFDGLFGSAEGEVAWGEGMLVFGL